MKLVLGYMLSAVGRRFLRGFPACTRSVWTSKSPSNDSSFNRAASHADIVPENVRPCRAGRSHILQPCSNSAVAQLATGAIYGSSPSGP